MRGARVCLALALAACSEPATIDAIVDANGVTITSTQPMTAVELHDSAGLPVVRMRPPAATAALTMTGRLAPGEYTVVATIDGAPYEAHVTVPERPAVALEVQAVPGGPWVAAGDLAIPVIEGGAAEVLLGLTGGPGMPPEVVVDGESVALGVEGQRLIRRITVGGAPRRVMVEQVAAAAPAAPAGAAAAPAAPAGAAAPPAGAAPAATPFAAFTLTPHLVRLDTLAAALTVASDVFPAESTGEPDLGRPASRVTLPSPLWERLVRAVGLGGRRRDTVAPWAFWGVRLENTGAEPVDVQVTLYVEQDGAAAPAFRPHLRDGEGETDRVAVLLRVPTGGATAALPLFVNTDAVVAGAYTAVLTVSPLGSAVELHTARRPLYVGRGDPVASVGFGASIVAALAGVALIGLRLRRWLTTPTSELMTIALFGSALFVVGTASDVLAMGVGVVFGPLSTLFTGLLSDLGRYTLLATLITLIPRSGTLALAIVTGTFLRGFTTGSYSPTDLLYLGLTVGYTEAFAAVAGLTRPGWPDEPAVRRFLRLSLGFAGASVCITLSGIWIHVVLARLFFAPWYIAMQAIGPGFLYTIVACWVATGFAESLRRVEP